MADAAEDLLAFSAFPHVHWRRIWSTNPAPQRRDQATDQRRRHLPNDQAVARLVTAVVVETHGEWAVAERRYLSEESMAALSGAPERKEVPLANTT